jgi:hypothetical protein
VRGENEQESFHKENTPQKTHTIGLNKKLKNRNRAWEKEKDRWKALSGSIKERRLLRIEIKNSSYTSGLIYFLF